MSKKKKKNYNKKKVNKNINRKNASKNVKKINYSKKGANQTKLNKKKKNTNKSAKKINTKTKKNLDNKQIKKTQSKKLEVNEREKESLDIDIKKETILKTNDNHEINEKKKLKNSETKKDELINQSKHTKNKKMKKKITKIIMILLVIMIVIFTTLFIVKKNIKLTLIGNKTETIEVYDEYKDPGFKATFFNLNINHLVETETNIDTDKVGRYQIRYKLNTLLKKEIIREIDVVDTIPPTLTLNGDETVNICVGDNYDDKGISIKDNYDSNLDDKLTVDNQLNINKIGSYTITYTVRDNSNNVSSIKRTINVKTCTTIKPTTKNSCTYSNKIEQYICKNDIDVSIGYYNLTNNKTYYYKNTKLYYGASLIKTLDALYLYDNNLITDELDEYVKKAITVSDNPSHHYLVNYIGKDNLKNYGIKIGAKNTLVGSDNFGLTSVNDQIAYMKKLYEITKDNQYPKLKEYFLNTRKNCLLFEGSPAIMHKYGHWEYIYHNSGIVLDDNPYIVVILTSEGYNDYQTIIKDLSKLVYEYHLEN